MVRNFLWLAAAVGPPRRPRPPPRPRRLHPDRAVRPVVVDRSGVGRQGGSNVSVQKVQQPRLSGKGCPGSPRGRWLARQPERRFSLASTMKVRSVLKAAKPPVPEAQVNPRDAPWPGMGKPPRHALAGA